MNDIDKLWQKINSNEEKTLHMINSLKEEIKEIKKETITRELQIGLNEWQERQTTPRRIGSKSKGILRQLDEKTLKELGLLTRQKHRHDRYKINGLGKIQITRINIKERLIEIKVIPDDTKRTQTPTKPRKIKKKKGRPKKELRKHLPNKEARAKELYKIQEEAKEKFMNRLIKKPIEPKELEKQMLPQPPMPKEYQKIKPEETLELLTEQLTNTDERINYINQELGRLATNNIINEQTKKQTKNDLQNQREELRKKKGEIHQKIRTRIEEKQNE